MLEEVGVQFWDGAGGWLVQRPVAAVCIVLDLYLHFFLSKAVGSRVCCIAMAVSVACGSSTCFAGIVSLTSLQFIQCSEAEFKVSFIVNRIAYQCHVFCCCRAEGAVGGLPVSLTLTTADGCVSLGGKVHSVDALRDSWREGMGLASMPSGARRLPIFCPLQRGCCFYARCRGQDKASICARE
jgi:hypothetical protein